jgi:integrase
LDQLSVSYFAATNPLRKPRTCLLYGGLWRLHISPAIGAEKPHTVRKARIVELHRTLGAKHPATANRVVVLLSHFFEWCREADALDSESNPARGIKKFPVGKRFRYLSAEEFTALGRALVKAETEGVQWHPDPEKKLKHAPRPENRRVKIDKFSAAALRLLIFTGARLREILNLQWRYVDLDRGLLLLPDSKTGPKVIVLAAPAIEVLDDLKSVRSNNPKAKFVIEGKDPSKAKADLQRPWELIRREAALEDFRLHDLRHSFASVGAAANLGLPVIGELLGHSDPATTSRYAHLATGPLRAAADGITAKISEMMNG